MAILIAVNGYQADPDGWLAMLLSEARPDDEIVIVDPKFDSNYDDSIARALPLAVAAGVDLRYVHLETRHRSKSLNRGLDESSAEIVLFLGDDIVPRTGLMAAHRRFHADHPEPTTVAIGGVKLPDEFRNRFAVWLETSGHLYGMAAHGEQAQLPNGFFYVANSSAKRSLVDEVGRFDEAFPHHGWDDFELGLRMRAASMTSTFLPDAKAWHQHRITLRSWLATMKESGESARVFESLHPGPYGWSPTMAVPPWRHRAGSIARLARYGLRRDPADLGRFYRRVLDGAFCAGYRASSRVPSSTSRPDPRSRSATTLV
jgi:GT2 family glycosyltransferase